MPDMVKAPAQEMILTIYPEEIEKYFLDKHIKIPTLPSDMDTKYAVDFFTMEIGSAQQYYDYLTQEILFWKENDPRNKLGVFSHISTLNTALSEFDNAIKQHRSNAQNRVNLMYNSLNSSTNRMTREGSLYSKLQIASFIVSFSDYSADFIGGVKLYFQKIRTANLPVTVDGLDGYYAAMEYSKVLDSYKVNSGNCVNEFRVNLELASANYAMLNASYTSALQEQKQRIHAIEDQTNNHFEEFEKTSEYYFASAAQRLSDLEHLYSEKLKLSEPAHYWKTIDSDYRKKGTKWLIISCVLAVSIVAGLICVILFVPDLFSNTTYWIENLKNSIILTIITSIAIYMLRLCVKMSTTSYHLSRDAKERENLSYFYLALIEKDAVTDKERALILNALFSRSDTGLLKGDASPSMPSNISDLVDIVSKVHNEK